MNVSRLCREQGISRNTFYVLVGRFRTEGAAAFTTRSTRPHHSPTGTGPELREAIVRARTELDDEGFDNGPISIVWRLEAQGLDPTPSRSTVYRVPGTGYYGSVARSFLSHARSPVHAAVSSTPPPTGAGKWMASSLDLSMEVIANVPALH